MIDKSTIIFQLVNPEIYKSILKDCPSRDFFDMAVKYCYIEENEEGFKICHITNEIAVYLGLTEEDLYSLAKENTHKLMKPMVISVNDFGNISSAKIPDKYKAWVISNEWKTFGTNLLLCENELHLLESLADRVKSDLLISLNVTHEILAVSINLTTPQYLLEMNAEMRALNLIKEKEHLSPHIYKYNRDTKQISMIIS